MEMRIQFKPYMMSVVTDSIHARKPKPSTKYPPMNAPIMLPVSPLNPNQLGKTPSKMIGRYRRVNFGTAIKPDKKKNKAYNAADITIIETSLAPNFIF